MVIDLTRSYVSNNCPFLYLTLEDANSNHNLGESFWADNKVIHQHFHLFHLTPRSTEKQSCANLCNE